MLNLYRFMQLFWLLLFIGVVIACITTVLGIWSKVRTHMKDVDLLREQAHLRVQDQVIPELVVFDPSSVSEQKSSSEVNRAQESEKKTTIKKNSLIMVERLLSANRPVESDVRGNLGPPSVVTEENVSDWLTDRWQSARNMRGEPILGEHWLDVDLGEHCTLTKIVLDWEDAYCTDYDLIGHSGRVSKDGVLRDSRKIASGKDARTSHPTKQHVVHEIVLPASIPSHGRKSKHKFRYVRLVMHSPATQWAPSLWRFQIYGVGNNE